MFKTVKLLLVTFAAMAAFAAHGQAFQLFGTAGADKTGPGEKPAIGITSGSNVAKGPAGAPLHGGKSQTPKLKFETDAEADNGKTDIWIPGLGVVGQMPKLDFGLEMLYGSDRDESGFSLNEQQELEDFNSDFAIKGTIKRKF